MGRPSLSLPRGLGRRSVALSPNNLLSLAGMINRPVVNRASIEVGQLVDIVVRWDDGSYPPVTGLTVRVSRRTVWVPIGQVGEMTSKQVTLSSARVDLRDYQPRTGEVGVAKDVLDRQLVDIEGARVVRASDLYLAELAGTWRLVGVDVGLRTLLRRLGPTRWRTHPTPDQVIDWGAIQHFAGPPGQLRLSESRGELRRLRPGELADLLERLGRVERQALIDEVGAEAAADALEEMEAEELQILLRESTPERAAELIATMEPDEAADALRPLEPGPRLEVLAALDPEVASQLAELAAYPETTAGGCMTSRLVLSSPDDSVEEVRARLRDETDHRTEIDSVLIVDRDGTLIDDISLFELLVADPAARLRDLVVEPWPVTVTVDQPLHEVVEALVENRAASLVVIDEEGRPVGRILADDVVDALVSDKGRLRFPRILR